MKVELRNLTVVCPTLDSGNICPACPKVHTCTCISYIKYDFVSIQESGTMILSMDALFGLPRKQSAGHSYREALHGNTYFVDQASVDEFVQSHIQEKKLPQVIIMVIHNPVLGTLIVYY